MNMPACPLFNEQTSRVLAHDLHWENKVYKRKRSIGHFGKYHNTFCLSPQILHKHCFQFLLRLKMVPKENENNAYAKFGWTNKECYGIFRGGLLAHSSTVLSIRNSPNWPWQIAI